MSLEQAAIVQSDGLFIPETDFVVEPVRVLNGLRTDERTPESGRKLIGTVIRSLLSDSARDENHH